MQEDTINKLSKEVVAGYFRGGNIIELLEAANTKLKKAGIKNENSRE